jgi:L-fuculose-phosphate aldolase
VSAARNGHGARDIGRHSREVMTIATPGDEQSLRLAVVEAARALNPLGINRGKAGNVSARCGEGLLITPSGLPYERTTADDVVLLALDGNVRSGALEPSSEWHFHCAIYRARPEVGAIVHVHAPFATALACLGRGIPAFHYMVAKAGGPDIRCARYATFGSEELARYAVEALHERLACLLSHHGMIALGASVDGALAMAVDVEALAEIYCRTLQLGEPSLLDAAEMERVREKFRGYGPRRDRGPPR